MEFTLPVFIFVMSIYSITAKPPDYIKICHQDDPNITQCIINSVLHIQPRFKDGIPELNFPSFEPLALDNIHLRNGPKSASIEANLTEIKVFGISDFELEEFKVDIKKLRFDFKVKLPFLHFIGNYKLKIQFLVLNLQGEGPVQGNLTNYQFVGRLKGHKINKGGEEFVEFEKMGLKISIGQIHTKLENLFQQDQVLGQTANDLINENSDLLFAEVKPALENSIALQITNITNGIMSSSPYKELFPK